MKSKSGRGHSDGAASLWEWNPKDRNKKQGKQFPVTEFLQDNFKKVEEMVVGPGFGVGVGCGIGVGIGLVGGVGYGDLPWNQLQVLFGIGIGCGAGFGFGYGRGVGYGSSWDSSVSYLLDGKTNSKKEKGSK